MKSRIFYFVLVAVLLWANEAAACTGRCAIDTAYDAFERLLWVSGIFSVVVWVVKMGLYSGIVTRLLAVKLFGVHCFLIVLFNAFVAAIPQGDGPTALWYIYNDMSFGSVPLHPWLAAIISGSMLLFSWAVMCAFEWRLLQKTISPENVKIMKTFIVLANLFYASMLVFIAALVR